MSNVVLLLEDEEDLAGLVEDLLATADYVVVRATDVDDLLQKAADHSPCVALLDGTSPTHFDLWWLGPKLSELGVPAVAFTAHVRAIEEFRTDPHEFAGVIPKPFNTDEFLSVVNSICWDGSQVAAS